MYEQLARANGTPTIYIPLPLRIGLLGNVYKYSQMSTLCRAHTEFPLLPINIQPNFPTQKGKQTDIMYLVCLRLVAFPLQQIF